MSERIDETEIEIEEIERLLTEHIKWLRKEIELQKEDIPEQDLKVLLMLLDECKKLWKMIRNRIVFIEGSIET